MNIHGNRYGLFLDMHHTQGSAKDQTEDQEERLRKLEQHLELLKVAEEDQKGLEDMTREQVEMVVQMAQALEEEDAAIRQKCEEIIARAQSLGDNIEIEPIMRRVHRTLLSWQKKQNGLTARLMEMALGARESQKKIAETRESLASTKTAMTALLPKFQRLHEVAARAWQKEASHMPIDTTAFLASESTHLISKLHTVETHQERMEKKLETLRKQVMEGEQLIQQFRKQLNEQKPQDALKLHRMVDVAEVRLEWQKSRLARQTSEVACGRVELSKQREISDVVWLFATSLKEETPKQTAQSNEEGPAQKRARNH